MVVEIWFFGIIVLIVVSLIARVGSSNQYPNIILVHLLSLPLSRNAICL